jgi:TPR repeat protein
MIESDMIERSENQDDVVEETTGAIDRSLLVPPGMRARQYIGQLRANGKPFPLSQVFDKAQQYRYDGSLADAYLLYFFAARENHLPSMMTMGEMSDPLRFRAEDTLLDQADPIQAWKWYQKAAQLNHAQAAQRLDELASWARDAAAGGDAAARQLLLNIQ